MSLNEIKIELFDKCHELVYNSMKQGKDETLDDFHTRHGKLMKKLFQELSGDVVAFYQENEKHVAKLNLK